MTVGFGLPSVATFKAKQEPPYYLSRGTGGSQEPLVFFRQGHHSEFRGEAGISPGEALDAVVEFVTTGERPACIAWDEV
jgi:hypothetical protein